MATSSRPLQMITCSLYLFSTFNNYGYIINLFVLETMLFTWDLVFVSHYRHQPTSSSWLCEVERLYHRILLSTETTINHHTVNHNDLMILYLLILNPIVTSLKPKLFSDIYRACLIMNRRAASYRMLMMICCCCWGGTGCKPPAPRGSETGVSCTACISHEIPHC